MTKQKENGSTHIRFEWERQLRNSPLDAYAKAIGLILATYADAKGVAFPSVSTLAKKATLSTKRTRCLLHELAKHQWITISFGGETVSNTYRLTVPKYVNATTPTRIGTLHVEGELRSKPRFDWEIAIRDSELLDFAKKSMALVLATYETNLVAVPSIEELAESSSRSRRRVYQLVKDLADGGWLTITVRGRHKSNVYELTNPVKTRSERANDGRGPMVGIVTKCATGEQSNVPRAGVECATGVSERATGGSQTPVVSLVDITPLENFTSSAARKRVSDDEKKGVEAILAKCDSILGLAFANDRRAMKDQQGMIRMITQLLDREVPERAIIHELTEGGYPHFTHPASGMHKRLKDYVDRRHVVDYPVLPVASNEAVLKLLAEVAETMRAKANEHLGLRDRKVPAVEYVSCFDLPSSDSEFS
jgi:hypothetical protein